MNFLFDLKYAWRLLIKSWGYSLMCASVVALSVGLAVWTNAIAYSQMFKPLGFPESDRWYSIQIAPDPAVSARPYVDAYTYQELLAHNRSANHLGGFVYGEAVLSEGEASMVLRAGTISPRLLAATRVAPFLGRVFEEKDGQPGAGAVAVISYETWQRYFAGDRTIVGKTARIDAAPVQIIGVMPKEFMAFQDFEMWTPLQMPVLARPQDSTMTLSPLIALKEGQDLNAVLNEMKAAVKGVNRDYPRLFHAGRSVSLVPATRMYTHNVLPIIVMLAAMASAVLLLGCVNISMVFFARLLERSRELALRTALGASRPRILRQCLLETGLVVMLGLAAGYELAVLGIEWTHGISAFGSRILASGRPTRLPELHNADLIVAVIAAIVIWLLSTLLPALRVSKQDAAVVLAGSGKGATVRGNSKSVAILVGVQVAISCFVLVTCGNVVLAIQREVNKPRHIDTTNVVYTTDPTVFTERYAEPAQRLRYWDDLKAAIETRVPRAQAAFTTSAPTRPARVAASIETQQGADNKGALLLPVTVVSENYFDTMGVSLRSGRLFDSTDNDHSLPVAIVDESMAARYWPHQNAVDKRVQLNSSDNRGWLTIVGVVSNVGSAPYRADAEIGTLYQPLRQAIPSSFEVLVKLPDAADHRVALRAAAYAVDRDLPLHNLQTLDDFLTAVSQSYPAMVRLFIVIALITTLLAASGLFGLISRSVAQRTQDVGIRRALGATAWRATSMFLRQGAVYLSISIVGLALAVMLMPFFSRAITNILDAVVPATLSVFLLLAVVIFTASYLPTRRALALEPGDALRYE